MPLMQLKTNVSSEQSDRNRVAARLSSVVADMLGKPEDYVMVDVVPDATLVFAGTDDPAAFVALASLGLDEQRTTEYSGSICELLHEELGIDPSRVYIAFSSPDRHMWGYNNGTFAR